MSEEFCIVFTSEAGNRRRYRFVKRPVHDTWRRFEEERDGGEWRPVGTEIVSDVGWQCCPEPDGGELRV